MLKKGAYFLTAPSRMTLPTERKPYTPEFPVSTNTFRLIRALLRTKSNIVFVACAGQGVRIFGIEQEETEMYDSSQVPAATVIYRRETDLNKVAEVSQDDAYLLDHAGVTAGHLYYDAAFIYEYHDGTFWTSDGSVECWGTLEECESLLADGEYILGGERRAAL